MRLEHSAPRRPGSLRAGRGARPRSSLRRAGGILDAGVSGRHRVAGLASDMPDLIRQSHILCLPTSYGEGVPRILLEAAAWARPIVATDSPGCREIVRHGDNGCSYPQGDGKALWKRSSSSSRMSSPNCDGGSRSPDRGQRVLVRAGDRREPCCLSHDDPLDLVTSAPPQICLSTLAG